MNRRAVAALAALAALLVAALWLVQRGRESTPSTEALARAPIAEPTSASELATPVAPETPAAREPAAKAPEEVPVGTRTTPPAEPRSEGEATIEVLVLSRETQTPLSGVQLGVVRNGSRQRSWVMTQENEGELTVSPQSDGEGRVVFRVPPGDYEVSTTRRPFEDSDFESSSVEVLGLADGSTRSVVLELGTPVEALFYGELLDDETGDPIPRARIHAFRSLRKAALSKPPEALDTPGVSCDISGRFEVVHRALQPTYVRIDAPGYALALGAMQPGSTPQSRGTFRLRRPARLAVTVLDEGKPAAGLDVEVRYGPDDLEITGEGLMIGEVETNSRGEMRHVGEIERRATTDALGTCSFDGVPPRVGLDVKVLRGTRVVRELPGKHRLEPGENGQLSIDLSAGCTIRGLALDHGESAIEGLEIWLVEAEEVVEDRPVDRATLPSRSKVDKDHATTDARGSFVFENVPAGAWLVGPAPEKQRLRGVAPRAPMPDDRRVAPVASRVEIAESDRVRDVTLEVYVGLFIRGHVVGATGSSEDDVLIYATEEALMFETRELDSEDRFTLGPLAPGEYWVQCYRDGELSIPVQARAGDEDIELTFDTRPKGTLRGRVTGFPGTTVHGFLMFFPTDGSELEACGLPLEPDGTFEGQDIPAGAYDVSVSTGDGFVAFLPGVLVEAEEARELELPLDRGAELRLRFEGNSAPIGVVVASTSEGVVGLQVIPTEASETVQLFVPAGRIHLVVQWGSAMPLENETGQDVTVAAGEEKEIVFDLQGR
jgi:hypothetical protein